MDELNPASSTIGQTSESHEQSKPLEDTKLKQQSKKVIRLLRWLFGFLILLYAIPSFFIKFLYGLTAFLLSLLILPIPVYKLQDRK